MWPEFGLTSIDPGCVVQHPPGHRTLNYDFLQLNPKFVITLDRSLNKRFIMPSRKQPLITVLDLTGGLVASLIFFGGAMVERDAGGNHQGSSGPGGGVRPSACQEGCLEGVEARVRGAATLIREGTSWGVVVRVNRQACLGCWEYFQVALRRFVDETPTVGCQVSFRASRRVREKAAVLLVDVVLSE